MLFRVTDRAARDELAPECRRAAPPPPQSVELALGERGRQMDAALYRRIAGEMRELGIETLGLACLGEPFPCRRLAEAVRYAKEACGYGHVYVAADGAAGAARMRGCMEAGLDRLDLRPGIDAGEARRVSDEVAAATGHRCEVHESRAPCRFAPPCRSLFAEGHVSCDGRLTACTYPDERFDMGDVAHHGFMRAWHGEPFQRLRRAHLAGDFSGTACESYCGASAVTPPGPTPPAH